ncbi:UbiA family prenyltransferase [Candidatus Micrarchaeota archaeon]|nr:UbiA family prenyltransferase [Candidatus Micrarchaeota archaeon]
MGFLAELWKLTRFEHALMLAFAVLAGEIIVLGSFPSIEQIFIVSLLVPILSEMGSFSLNDFLDVETDRKNKRTDRPLVRGTIEKKFAFNLAVICIVLSTLLAYFINVYAFLTAVLFNILAVAYNYRLKDTPLAGNLYIGATMAIPFIFGNFVYSAEINSSVVFVSILAFIAGTAREIMKSSEDIEGDKEARGSKTLPVIIGLKNANIISGILFLAAVLVSIYFFYLGFNLISLMLIFGSDIGFGHTAYKLIFGEPSKKEMGELRKNTLLFLAVGLIGISLGALF